MSVPASLTRSTVTVLVPGVVALSPWLLALLQHTDATLGFESYPTIAHAVFFSAVVVVGTICEGLGSYIEVQWDADHESELAVRDNWFSYLGRVVEKEPVGYRYLSRLATAMYFELAMITAVPIFSLGGGLLALLRFPQHFFLIVALTALVAGTAVVFFGSQARTTHRVICEARKEIMARAPAG